VVVDVDRAAGDAAVATDFFVAACGGGPGDYGGALRLSRRVGRESHVPTGPTSREAPLPEIFPGGRALISRTAVEAQRPITECT